MENIIFKLFQFHIQKNPKMRSYYFRHKDLLQKKCGQFSLAKWLQNEKEIELAKELSLYGPLEESDLQDKETKKIIRQWNKNLPQDPNFFKMLETQINLWNKFKDKSILEFIESEDAKIWFKKRSKLQRKALFLLDQPFKNSKLKALKHQALVRRLIRANPLMTYRDLQSLRVRNAQKIYENFPQRVCHRLSFLNQILAELDNAKEI